MSGFRHIFYYAFLACLFLAGCDSPSGIQDPDKSYFLKFYGLDGDQTGDDLLILPDGNLILFGTTKPSGVSTTSQWYLVKADPKGNVLWEKKFGGPFNDEARDIELTTNNELLLVGNTYKSATDRDIKILKLSLSGDSLAGTSVGLKNSLGADTDEDAVSVSLTTDGFIVAGSSSNTDLKPSVGASNDQRDAIHLRFFDNLTIYSTSWRKAHGPGSYDVAVKVIQVSATQFYLFGYTNTLVVGHSNPDFNYWVFGLGSNGDANTADQFSGTLNDDEKLSSFCVAPTQSIEGYFLGGTTRSATGLTDFYTTKLRKPLSFISTDLQFEKPLSIQLGINLPERTSVFASQSGGFFVLGNENNFNKDQNLILTKINFDGSLAWGTPIVFGGEGLDACGAVQELPDGKILLIGTMRTGRPDVGEFKMTLIKTSRDGKLTN